MRSARSVTKHSLAHSQGTRRPHLSLRGLQAILLSLESTVRGLQWGERHSTWSDYYSGGHNYTAEAMSAKERLIAEFIRAVRPKVVWDLGANDGRFSRIAAACGAETVVAWDADPSCVEQNYRRVAEERDAVVHPVLVDLTNPTPGIGWANKERAALVERGPADLTLALGLIHHLAIANNVPLENLAAFLATISKQLIVEWIPREDSQVQRLLASRADIFANYSQQSFENALCEFFIVEQSMPIDAAARTLYLLKVRS